MSFSRVNLSQFITRPMLMMTTILVPIDVIALALAVNLSPGYVLDQMQAVHGVQQ
jgi:hypothetical protein